MRNHLISPQCDANTMFNNVNLPEIHASEGRDIPQHAID